MKRRQGKKISIDLDSCAKFWRAMAEAMDAIAAQHAMRNAGPDWDRAGFNFGVIKKDKS